MGNISHTAGKVLTQAANCECSEVKRLMPLNKKGMIAGEDSEYNDGYYRDF